MPESLRESRLFLPTREGQAPLLLTYQANRERFGGTVLVYPGYSATKEVQRLEAAALANAGLLAVAVDAVGHGERRWDDLHTGKLVEIIERSVAELPDLVDGLTGLFGSRAGRFGLCGISMGGFITFAAAAAEPRLAAFAPVLGSPDWSDLSGGDVAIERRSPLRHMEAFAGRPLLVQNAGRDETVSSEASWAFVDALRRSWPGAPGTLEYREYPDSEHTMREEDWNDLWPRVVTWMRTHLGAAVSPLGRIDVGLQSPR
jgi:dienelactone hydrolase